MYSLAIANQPFSKAIDDLKDANSVMDYFNNISKVIQIGGNSTLGKGIVEISCEGCKK
jgi:CRISPR/Cas system CMR subunit Cmr4 (Cas7 group RAMP superfamily)